MATSEQREASERLLARNAIRRAMHYLLHAETSDDLGDHLRLAASNAAKALDECKKIEGHYQRAIAELKKRGL